MISLLPLLLLGAPLDCGAGATLDVTPAGLVLHLPAGPGKVQRPAAPAQPSGDPREVTAPAPAGFTPTTCAWAAAHGLLHATSEGAQWLFRVEADGRVTLVRQGALEAPRPWRFDAARGEVYDESPAADRCDGTPIRVNRRRWGKTGWEPVVHVMAPPPGGVATVPAVKGPPPGVRRRPWFAAPPPAVAEPEDDASDEPPAPVRLTDHNATTAWVSTGPGPGLTLVWRLPAPLRRLRAVSILPGHGGDETSFARHARLRTFTLTAGGRTVRVELPADPRLVPGSHHVPWHVAFPEAVDAACLELTVERVWPGDARVASSKVPFASGKVPLASGDVPVAAGQAPLAPGEGNLALSELTLFTELDLAADPVAAILAGLLDRTFTPAQVLPALAGVPDERLLAAWEAASDTVVKRTLGDELARRVSPGLVAAQLELLAWAAPEQVARLQKTLAAPHARDALFARLRPDADPAYLARLLPPWLAGGAPDPVRLLALARAGVQLAAITRDGVRPADRPALITAWCRDLLTLPFLFDHWAPRDPAAHDAATACLARLRPPRSLRGRLTWLQAAATLADPRLAAPVHRLAQDDHTPAVKLQALATLLHLKPGPDALFRLARTPRPDAQLVLLAHWPASAPLPPELAALAKSPWPPVQRAALLLLSERCDPRFADAARPILADPAHELWYPLVERVKTCGFAALRLDLVKTFRAPKLADEPFSTLAQLFAEKRETWAAELVAARVRRFFDPKVPRAALEERVTAGTWLLRALAAFARPADAPLLLQLARRPLPAPFLEVLASILPEAPGARCPAAPPRCWRDPASWSAYMSTCNR